MICNGGIFGFVTDICNFCEFPYATVCQQIVKFCIVTAKLSKGTGLTPMSNPNLKCLGISNVNRSNFR